MGYKDTTTSKQWGGQRPGSGPHRKRLLFDKDAARDLAVLTKRWRVTRNNPALTEEEVVMELVRQSLSKSTSSSPCSTEQEQ